MRLVIQRVANASVKVPAESYEASIGKGLLVLAAFIDVEEHAGRKPAKGIFGADMKVSLLNDGPVTIIVDSKLKF